MIRDKDIRYTKHTNRTYSLFSSNFFEMQLGHLSIVFDIIGSWPLAFLMLILILYEIVFLVEMYFCDLFTPELSPNLLKSLEKEIWVYFKALTAVINRILLKIFYQFNDLQSNSYSRLTWCERCTSSM